VAHYPAQHMTRPRLSQYRRLISRLKAARLEAGLTQAAVARYFHQPQSFISKCESGERAVDAVELGEFAQLYGKPLNYFVSEPRGARLSSARRPRR
jgi:transcriptional regulator with XRE-family HTH domain